jgi:hypothetical protein
MLPAIFKLEFFLKNQYLVAAGILIGIAVAVWAGPDTKAGFLVIIIICILIMIVIRGVVRGVYSNAQLKAKEDNEDNDASGEKEGDKAGAGRDTSAERVVETEGAPEKNQKKPD